MQRLMLGAKLPASPQRRCGSGRTAAAAAARPGVGGAAARRLAGNASAARAAALFSFGKRDSGVPTLGRGDFGPDEVEDYFNYMGMLASEGTYDRLEAMLASGVPPVDLLLLMAASEDDAPKVEELLRAGADVRARDLQGRAPAELATKPEVLAMLAAAEEKAGGA